MNSKFLKAILSMTKPKCNFHDIATLTIVEKERIKIFQKPENQQLKKQKKKSLKIPMLFVSISISFEQVIS